MKILIISYFFPPVNRIGALRLGKMAKYFQKFGHDVRVITYKHDQSDLSAPLEVPADHCKFVESIRFEQTIGEEYYQKSPLKKILIRLNRAWKHKRGLFLLPDSSWPWYRDAIKKSDYIISEWKPDLIYSSALPISSHFIARKVATTHKIPWIAEYRDLWSGGHGARVSNFRSFFLKRIETWLLKPASGLITVSQPLAAYLKWAHRKETAVVFNGFDITPSMKKRQHDKPSNHEARLTVVYTGAIYEGRDPGLLFQTLSSMGEANNEIKVIFYTPNRELLTGLVDHYHVGNCVEIRDVIPYNESLNVQQQADLLLYLSYSSKTHSGRGILSGKVFEYLGAKRPILSIGSDNTHLLIKEKLMNHAENSEELEQMLRKWVNEKKENGSITYNLNEEARLVYSREEQTRRAEEFILSVVS